MDGPQASTFSHISFIVVAIVGKAPREDEAIGSMCEAGGGVLHAAIRKVAWLGRSKAQDRLGAEFRVMLSHVA